MRRSQVVTFQRRVTRLKPSWSPGLNLLQKGGAADGAGGGMWEKRKKGFPKHVRAKQEGEASVMQGLGWNCEQIKLHNWLARH